MLAPKDLIDFFKQAAPPLFLLESARNPADLGEFDCGPEQVVKVPIEHHRCVVGHAEYEAVQFNRSSVRLKPIRIN